FAYTVWLTPYATHTCSAFLVASDPKDGDKSKQLTWQDTTRTYLAYPYQPPYTDYDPFWSPLGYEVAFDRDDWTIFRKGIPGVAGVPDTSLHLVTQSGVRHNGDLTPGISPDGQSVAFARRAFSDAALPFNLWKIPIGGGTAKRLTRTTGVGITDFYPRWSPDGAWILFDRRFPADTITHHSVTHGIFKVTADSGAVVQVYGPVEPPAGGDTLIAVTPAWSADGLVVTASRGKRVSAPAESVLACKTYTFDPSLSVSQMTPILNYDDPRFTVTTAGVDVGPTPVL